ncbi:MAG: transcription-repair coupling factor [candidate division Zixibacteria bacterium]|nr:transcription-repair coupling factor [candidate division Zixibacteria bacterium]
MTDSKLASRIKTLFSASGQFELLRVDIEQAKTDRSVGRIAPVRVSGLAGGSLAFLLAALYERTDGNILMVTSNYDDGQNLSDDLINIVGDEAVGYFPSRQTLPYEFRSPSGDITGQRLTALGGFLSPQKKIIVAPAAAIIEPTMARSTFVAESLRLTVGQKLNPEELIDRMTALGFNRVGAVEEVGDFAVRGGLIDLFSPASDLPVRAEFFGDEIDSLRHFDVRDQRTIERLEAIDLLPRREVSIRSETLESFLEKLHPKDADLVRARFIGEPELPGLEWLAAGFGLERGSVLDYLDDNDLVVLDGGKGLVEDMRRLYEDGEKLFQRAKDRFVAPPPIEKYYLSPADQMGKMSSHVAVDILPFRSQTTETIDFQCREHPALNSRMDYLQEITAGYIQKGYYSVITGDNAGQAMRLGEILTGRKIEVPVEVFHIHAGFVSDTLKLALLTDHQIFSRQFRRIKRRRYKEGVALTSYTNLNPGDVVVHADYGLARYSRLETIVIDGRTRDCLLLFYQGGDKLYVPIEEFNRVSKYAGKDATPRLSTLGTPAWEKLKKKTKKALADMAEELLKLYAERKMAPGFQFATDTVWQRQMEASFIYEETPDQLKAIDDVKRDMESAIPADRLICGDVGYGKTEVAVRAAFKAVENGKQVAILVPTTILAQQHYNTFTSRLREFPMRIDMLSRFKTRAEQKEIIEQVAAGKLDIVIGPHRLLSKDVQFADLGFLVVDEEQHFGVRHKERLRQLKKSVDTITLTATPIPRTLQMSLMGARDMTLITTSPRDRLPIFTEIVEFNPEAIAEAILREIDRGGQVFFVHNRVQTIDAMHRYLKKLLPQIEFGVAHGQMHEKELEGVMLAFLAGRYQVLLSTAIVESGLDIPSVNTIIINRADRFGLAQLYQLRGRVGRSPRRAYAYLMTPPYRLMTEDARKRLRAIEAHSDLGSGFALAMRDLEIRGAGNILGAQQSGFIDEIGFDLYTKLLEEAVAELKGEKIQRLPDTKLEARLDLFLPEDYVNVKQQKVDIYRRLADARSLDDIEAVREEVTDRFGKMPQEAVQLFDAAGLRLAASITGADKVKVGALRITVEYPATMEFKRAEIEAIRRAIDAPIEFSLTGGFKFTVDLSAIRSTDRLAYVRKALDRIGAGIRHFQRHGVAKP